MRGTRAGCDHGVSDCTVDYMKTPVTNIDDILFPGESRRLLDAQIAYVKRMLDAIESIPKTPQQPSSTPLGNGLKNGSVHAPQDCSGALITLTNGDEITVDLFQVNAGWWTAKNADHDHQCGQGATRQAAIDDLWAICQRDMLARRDREFRRIVAKAQESIP